MIGWSTAIQSVLSYSRLSPTSVLERNCSSLYIIRLLNRFIYNKLGTTESEGRRLYTMAPFLPASHHQPLVLDPLHRRDLFGGLEQYHPHGGAYELPRLRFSKFGPAETEGQEEPKRWQNVGTNLDGGRFIKTI